MEGSLVYFQDFAEHVSPTQPQENSEDSQKQDDYCMMMHSLHCGFEADKEFMDVLSRRSPTWMYDWMLELEEWESMSKDRIRKIYHATGSYDTIKKIRERLHGLQKKMPCWTLLTCIVEQAMKKFATSEDVAGMDEVHHFENKHIDAAMRFLADDQDCEIQEALRCVRETVEMRHIASLVTASARRQRTLERTEELARFIGSHVALLLETLYADLSCEERLLAHGAGTPPDPCRAFFRALYAAPSTPKTLEDGTSVARVRLVGPLGERPLHVCMFRAEDWGAGGATGDDPVKRGVLAGVAAFVGGADRLGLEEVDGSYGKDYCAAAGSYLRYPGLPWREGSAESGEVLDSGADDQDAGLTGRPGRRGPASFEPPFWAALEEWSGGAPAQDCWRRAGAGPGGLGGDAEALVTNGLYEGESPLLFAVAAGDAQSVRWILARSARSGSSIIRGPLPQFSPTWLREDQPARSSATPAPALPRTMCTAP